MTTKRKDHLCKNPWLEAAVAWEVCASLHREFAKGKDPFFNTRQADYVKHAADCRARYEQEQKNAVPIPDR